MNNNFKIKKQTSKGALKLIFSLFILMFFKNTFSQCDPVGITNSTYCVGEPAEINISDINSTATRYGWYTSLTDNTADYGTDGIGENFVAPNPATGVESFYYEIEETTTIGPTGAPNADGQVVDNDQTTSYAMPFEVTETTEINSYSVIVRLDDPLATYRFGTRLTNTVTNTTTESTWTTGTRAIFTLLGMDFYQVTVPVTGFTAMPGIEYSLEFVSEDDGTDIGADAIYWFQEGEFTTNNYVGGTITIQDPTKNVNGTNLSPLLLNWNVTVKCPRIEVVTQLSNQCCTPVGNNIDITTPDFTPTSYPVTLTATGTDVLPSLYYYWYDVNGTVVSSGQGTTTLSINEEGTYSIRAVTVPGDEAFRACYGSNSTIIGIKNIFAPDDVTICIGDALNLYATGAEGGYSWSSDDSTANDAIVSPNSQGTNVVLSDTGSYTFRVEGSVKLGNIAIDGKFENFEDSWNNDASLSNIPFETTYGISSFGGIFINGGSQFRVSEEPLAWASDRRFCENVPDYRTKYDPVTNTTIDRGNIFYADAHSGMPEVPLSDDFGETNYLWQLTDQEVIPNTTYEFTMDVSEWNNGDAPVIMLLVNGVSLNLEVNNVNVGNTYSPPSGANGCVWRTVTGTWNSGANTLATITVSEVANEPIGHEFAMDDITFAPVDRGLQADEVVVTVTDDCLELEARDDTMDVCLGDEVPLYLNQNSGVFVDWRDQTGTVISTNENTTVTPIGNNEYTATVRFPIENQFSNGGFESSQLTFETDLSRAGANVGTNQQIANPGNSTVINTSTDILQNQSDYTTNTPNGGMYFIRYNAAGTIIEQEISVLAGETYTFTVWMRDMEDGGSANQAIDLRVDGGTVSTFNVAQGSNWTEYTYSWTPTVSETIALELNVRNTPGPFWNRQVVPLALDDISLIRYGNERSDQVLVTTSPCRSLSLQEEVCNASGKRISYTTDGIFMGWFDANDVLINTDDTLRVNPLVPTTYYAKVGSGSPIVEVINRRFTVEPCCTQLQPTTSVTTGTATLCEGENLVLTATPDGGSSGPFTFQWYQGGNAISGATTDTYTVPTASSEPASYYSAVLTSSSSCTGESLKSDSVEITINGLPTASISGGGNFCTDANPQIEITLTGGADYFIDYSYNATPQTQVISTTNTYQFSPITSGEINTGTYELTRVEDVNGCVQTNFATSSVSIDTIPSLVISNTSAICDFGTQTANISFEVTGGMPVYTVSQENPSVGTLNASNVYTASFSAIGATTYDYEVSDASVCTGNQDVEAVSGILNCDCPESATLTVTGNSIICEEGGVNTSELTIVLDQGPNTITDWAFAIQGPDGNVLTGQDYRTVRYSGPTTFSVPVSDSGSYEIIDLNGTCNASIPGAVTIDYYPSPKGQVSGQMKVCEDGTDNPLITIDIQDVSYPASVVVSRTTGGDTTITFNSASETIQNMISDTYTLTRIADANNCEAKLSDITGIGSIELVNEPVAEIQSVDGDTDLGTGSVLLKITNQDQVVVTGNTMTDAYTGTWTIPLGQGTIALPNTNPVTIEDLNALAIFPDTLFGETGVSQLILSVVDTAGACDAKTDTLKIIRVNTRTAVPDYSITLCEDYSAFSENGQAITSGVETSYWIDRQGGIVTAGDTIFSRTLSVPTGMGAGTYEFDYVIENVLDPTVQVTTFTINLDELPSTASLVAPTIQTCDVMEQLNALTPTIGTGVWTKVSGTGDLVAGQESLPNATVENLLDGQSGEFRWRMSNGVCTNKSSVDVTISKSGNLTSSVINVDGTSITNGDTVGLCINATSELANGGFTTPNEVGTWSVLSGNSVTINTAETNPQNMTLNQAGITEIQWEISDALLAGCDPNSIAIFIDVAELPMASITALNTQGCVGDVLTAEINTNSSTINWLVDNSPVTATVSGTDYLLGTGLTDTPGGKIVTLEVSSTTCGTITDTRNVTISSVLDPQFEIVQPASLCGVGDVTLSLTNTNDLVGATYNWSYAGTGTSGVNDQATFTITNLAVTSGSDVTLTVGSGSFCNVSDSAQTKTISIVVVEEPIPSIPFSDTTICEGEAFTLLTSNVQSGTTVQWYLDGTIINGATSASFSGITTGGSYHLEEVDINGVCAPVSTQDVIVTIETALDPQFEIVQPTPLCGIGDVTVSLTNTNDLSGATYNWSYAGTGTEGVNNQDTFTITDLGVTSGSDVTLTVNSGSDCNVGLSEITKTVSIVVVEQPSPAFSFVEPDTAICEGQNLTLLTSNLQTNSTYQWFLDGLPISGATSSSLSNVSTGGIYRMEETDQNSVCLIPGVTQDITVTVNEFPQVSAGDDVELAIGEVANLNGSVTVGTAIWVETGTVDIVQNNVSLTSPLETTINGIYNLTLTSSNNGCEASDEVVITIKSGIVAPNVFTPNGDGKKDLFVVSGLESYEVAKMFIYNRYGVLVFESNGHYNNDLWNGGDVSDGVYYFVIDTGDGKGENHTGVIHVVR